MSLIDPEVQRQLVYQITQEDEKYFQLFDNGMYVDMLGTLMKNDMIPSMIALEQETLINMISVLPEDLLSTVAAQVDTGRTRVIKLYPRIGEIVQVVHDTVHIRLHQFVND